jgi:hypothetical protein
MTAENFLQEHLEVSHFYNDKYDKMCCLSEDIQKAMKEYATLKCKELLEIVAEKAKIVKTVVQAGEYYDESFSVNKDSILNAVNLKEFIQ